MAVCKGTISSPSRFPLWMRALLSFLTEWLRFASNLYTIFPCEPLKEEGLSVRQDNTINKSKWVSGRISFKEKLKTLKSAYPYNNSFLISNYWGLTCTVIKVARKKI